MRDRTVGYVRVSEQEADSEQYLAGEQIDAIAEWAAENGADVLDWFFDVGVSDAEPLDKRPAGSQLLSRLSRGDVTHVVVSSLGVLGKGRALLDAVQSLFSSKERIRVITVLPGPHEAVGPAESLTLERERAGKRRTLKAA